MDSVKVKALLECPQHTTQKELQRFLGFANFYRRFIHNYSSVAAPLTALTSSKVPFSLSAVAERAFSKLKKVFTSAPILITADPLLQFVV